MKDILIDTDMGIDDIIAIALLLNNKDINIKTISTVRGVADLTTGTQNLARLLTLLRETTIPIYQGFNPPQQKLDFPKIDRQRANNLTLLKDIPLPKSPFKKICVKTLNRNLFRFLNSSTSPISILCLGPLTNIAKIIQNSTIIKKNVKQIIIMGGAIFMSGNIPPDYLCEYNIALDPNAAKIVFSSGLPITLIATDTTNQARAKDKQFLKQVVLAKPQTAAGEIIKTIIINNRRDFIDFYDPLAAAILIDPKIISSSKKIILTITPDGQTIGQFNSQSLINLVTAIDKKAFYQHLITALK
ncbi:MAG: nucleoside hydrolase [Candidatus Beckwithbacteria bacterium]|nr:nucleoside hydrolase [Candidatus Beckwithbacteria bacterium]